MAFILIRKILFLITTLIGVSSFAQTNPTNPNILIIIADDLGVDYSNGYQSNNLMPTTPNIDNLRLNGLTFKNVWAAPKCSPTRAAIMSGKYGIKTGVLDTPGNLEPSHTSIFKAIENEIGNVYTDAVIGKWHIQSGTSDYNHTVQHGIDHFEGFWGGSVPDYYNWQKVSNGTESMVTEYATAHITNSALSWVNNQSQPWFLWLAHGAPHSPFHVPPAGTYTQTPTNNNAQKFTAAIESMDYEIGRLLAGIPTAILNNTIIVFIGDNGTPNGVLQNYPTGHGKNSLYQGGIHVPMIVSGATVGRVNETEEGLVHASDIYATVLEVVDANIAGGVNNSFSFKPLLSDATAQTRDYNYSENADGWTMRNSQYKLIHYYDCTEEFYDLVADDLETNDIIGSLTSNQEAIKEAFILEADILQKSWSCSDYIQNGTENGIDCGGYCAPCPGQTSFDCKEDSLIVCADILVDSFAFAENYISSEHLVSATEVVFQAGQCIELKGGFEADLGTAFQASIDNCILTGISNTACGNDNSTAYTNIGCCESPSSPSIYTETLSGASRMISTNNYPNHDFCWNNNYPSPQNYNVEMPAVPTQGCEITSILRSNGRPSYHFGLALNGVIFAPAPVLPFVFENSNTGEFNWDWVFEPTNVQGSGQGYVSLDCSSAHTGPQGYHYHGNMFQYIEETVQTGLSTQTAVPNSPTHIGWAADGYPILYRFGPDKNGNMKLLQPSYQLKYGNRPGDGVKAPCGSYNGRYTNDYRYIDCSGDLDECNGIAQSITLTTAQGTETFDYFYVITDDFPQISRCFKGTPDASFR